MGVALTGQTLKKRELRLSFLLLLPKQLQSHRSREVPQGGTAWVAVAKRLKNVNYREAVIETIVEQWSCEA